MEINECYICGESIDSMPSVTLSCNHIYHYECIYKTFLSNRYEKHVRKCPLCTKKCECLPLVNGIKKPIQSIHYINEYPSEYQNKPCSHIIKRGLRKGEVCGKACKMGYNVCGYHKK